MRNDINERWQICTKLVDFNAPSGIYIPGGGVFFKVMPTKNIRLAVDMPFYLNCKLADMEKFLAREYIGSCMGREFRYELRRDYTFIREVERKLLWRVAQSYGVTRPIVFAPWARRAVKICITDGLTAEELATLAPEVDGKRRITNDVLQAANWQIDLIGGVLVTNKRLSVTNLKLSDKAINFVSNGTDAKGKFLNVQSDLANQAFVLPEIAEDESQDFFITVEEDWQAQRVYTDANIPKYYTLTFGECEPDAWRNVWRDGYFLPRLRTDADISCELNRYQYEKIFSCKFERVIQPPLREKFSKRLIQRYETALRYPDADRTQELFRPKLYRAEQDDHRKNPDANRPQELFRATTYRPICYLHFSGDNIFLDDYANYVLEAMEKNYPEFIWAGVSDD